MTHSYVWYNTAASGRATLRELVYMCDVTHLYVWHDSFICVTWLIYMCDMIHLYVWHDSFICVTWLSGEREGNFERLWQKSKSFAGRMLQWFIEGIHVWDLTHGLIRLIHTRDMTHLWVWETRLMAGNPGALMDVSHSYVYMYDMTHSYVWHDSFICVYVWHDSCICVTRLIHMCICVTWLLHMCDMTHSYVHMCDMTHAHVCPTHSHGCHHSYIHPSTWISRHESCLSHS